MAAPNQIILQLTIVEGRNLAAKDRSGTSDPYVCIKLRDADNRTDKKQKYKTKILGKTLNPVWNQSFLFVNNSVNRLTFPVATLKSRTQRNFCFTVGIKYSTDDYMGEIEIPISAVLEKSYLYADNWLKLVAAKKGAEVSGEIRIQISTKSCAESERTKVYEANKNISLTPTPTRAHRRTIDTLPFSTFYEKFDVDPTGVIRRPQQVLKQKINILVTYDQELVFEFGLHCILYPLIIASSRVVETGSFNEIEILREGLGIDKQKEEPIRKRVDKFGLPGKESQLIELQHRLASVDKHPFYNVSTFKSPESFQKWRKNEIETVHKLTHDIIFSEKRFGARLVIKVIEGKELPPKDLNGKSDPYVIITVQGEKKKTKTKNRTLNPVWNQTLEFEITDPNTKVLLEVWDSDLTSKDDLMCRLVLPLTQFESPCCEKNKWFLLETKGQIHLEIDYQYPFSSYLAFSEQMLNNSQNPDKFPLSQPSQAIINSVQTTIDHNVLYNFLVKTLILYTKDLEEITSLEGEALLEEYSLRYGVSNLYKNLVYLLNLRIQPRSQLLHTVETMILELNKVNRKEITIKEEEMIDTFIEQFLIKIQGLLSQFKDIFPKNTPAGCVSALSNIVVLLHNSQNGANETLKKWVLVIKKGGKIVIIKGYITNKWENIIETSKHPDSTSEIRSPVELRMITEKVIQELNSDVYFKDSFPSEFNFLALSAQTYHDLMKKEIEDLCDNNVYHDEIFKLYFKLKEFVNIIKSRVTRFLQVIYFPNMESPVINLSTCFLPFVYTWMRNLRSKEEEWVQNSLRLDKKEPISSEDLYSCSVVDIFASLIQSLEFLQSLECEDTFMISNYLELASQTITLYNSELSKEITKSIESQWPEEKSILSLKSSQDPNQARRNAPIAIKVTPQLCVTLNNIEGTRQQLDKFASVIEDIILPKIESMETQTSANIVKDSYEKCTREAFKKIKDNLLSVVQFLVSNMQFFIEKSLLSTLTNDQDHALFDYLDDLFSMLSDHLYEDIFKKILQSMWVAIAGFLREVILGERKSIQLELEQLQHLVSKYEDLREYFYADGNGLTQKFLDEKTQFVRKLLTLLDMSTTDLIDLYNTMKVSQPVEEVENTEILKPEHVYVMIKSRKHDKEASDFLQELKKQQKNKKKSPKEEIAAPAPVSEKKSTKKEAEQEKLRKQFLLQDTEVIFDEWNVSHDSKTGFLLLTSTYLLFDSFFGGGPDGGHQIAVYLKEIKEIKRTKKFLYEVVDVVANDGTTYSFSSINNREDMIRDIKVQAQKAGNKTWK